MKCSMVLVMVLIWFGVLVMVCVSIWFCGLNMFVDRLFVLCIEVENVVCSSVIVCFLIIEIRWFYMICMWILKVVLVIVWFFCGLEVGCYWFVLLC